MIRQTILAFAGAAVLLASASAAAPRATADIHEVTPLRYRILASGPADGMHPSRKDEVVVRYTGRLPDGKVFDSSSEQPDGTATFPVGRLIPGWVVALQLMRPGDHWELTVPPEMAYGEKGAGGVIPPNATLVFDMELVSIVPPTVPAG